MGRMMNRLMKKVSHRNQEAPAKEPNLPEHTYEQDNQQSEPLHRDLKQTIQVIKNRLGHSDDLIIRKLMLKEGREAALCFTAGLTDSFILQEIVEQLITKRKRGTESPEHLLDDYKNHDLAVGDVKEIKDYTALFQALLTGDTVFLIDGEEHALSLGTKGWESRSVEEPTTQTVVRGPKESFTENIRTNTALIRRRIKSPDLWVESFTLGKETQTPVMIMYVQGIADPKIVEEVRERLNRIDVDAILESGPVEGLIEDAPFSMFPTVFTTERPDTVAASLLEGRIVIIVDGTPFTLIVPCQFVQFFQVSEDYYDRPYIASFTRMLRYICMLISTGLLSLYIAIITYHPETLPTPLINSIAAQRENVPFPAFVEVIFLMASFEILREAGIRMPRVIGPAISIVGGLVLGQASVEAGFVSAGMVILVATIALSDFVIPSSAMSDAIKLHRYLLLFLAASFGMFGIAVGLVALILHLCSLRSFGIPYMSPLGPFILSNQQDVLVRLPKWKEHQRPYLINQQNLVREQTSAPSPDNNSTKK